jgi:hypothetical protein
MNGGGAGRGGCDFKLSKGISHEFGIPELLRASQEVPIGNSTRYLTWQVHKQKLDSVSGALSQTPPGCEGDDTKVMPECISKMVARPVSRLVAVNSRYMHVSTVPRYSVNV